MENATKILCKTLSMGPSTGSRKKQILGPISAAPNHREPHPKRIDDDKHAALTFSLQLSAAGIPAASDVRSLTSTNPRRRKGANEKRKKSKFWNIASTALE